MDAPNNKGQDAIRDEIESEICHERAKAQYFEHRIQYTYYHFKLITLK